MSFVYDAAGEPRYFGLYMGYVVDNVDPEKMGRVTVMIPGLLEPASGWAWPMGWGGGSRRNGAWDVPKKGAGVGVMFHHGDIDEPVYMHGWYGREEAPAPAAEASAQSAADKIKCFESDRHLVVLDGVKGQVLIKDKESGMVIVMQKSKVMVGGERLLALQGALNGESIDPFTGLTHFALGNASKTVFVKK